MCKRVRVAIGFGAFVACVALVTSVGTLLLPFWWNTSAANGTEVGHGLFLKCFEPYSSDERNCTWGLRETFGQSGKGDYIVAVRYLWVTGSALLLLTTLFSFSICCKPLSTAWGVIVTSAFAFVAASTLAVAVLIFGLKMRREHEATNNEHFDWVYYVAIASSGCSAFAGCIIASILCFLPKNSPPK